MPIEDHQLSPSSQNSFTQMILVDQEYVLEHQTQKEDLYDLLIKEPSFVEKESIKDNDRPNLEILNFGDPKLSQLQVSEHQESSTHNNLFSRDQEDGKSQHIERTIKCRCSKSKCQKNYCECFKAGLSCTAQCICTDCCNDEKAHRLLKRLNQGNGCKCKRSRCLKNYCECHSNGKKCSSQCMCIECQNTSQPLQFPEQLLEYWEPTKKTKRELQLPPLLLINKNSSRLFSDLY